MVAKHGVQRHRDVGGGAVKLGMVERVEHSVQPGVQFLDVTDAIADRYEIMGEEKVRILFPEDHTHTIRRIRELLEVADRLTAGEKEASLPRSLGIHSYRAEQLAVQARRWSLPELESALQGLVDLDATVKNAPGYGASDAQRRLAFTMWLADFAGSGTRPSVAGVDR